MKRPTRWVTTWLQCAALVLAAGAATADSTSTRAGVDAGADTGSASTQAADYTRGWGPSIDEPIPLLQARDQRGELRDITNLSGDRGLLLFMVRSADW